MRTVITSYISALASFMSESGASGQRAPGEDFTFNQLALLVFAFQFDQVGAYRRVCLARGVTPASVSRWTEIPAVPVAAFKELEMTSLPAERRPFAFHSSGTTQGSPSRHYHDHESIRVYEASLWPWFQRHLLGDAPSSMGLLALTPTGAAAPHSSLVHMIETVRGRLAANTAVFGGTVDVDGAWQLSPEACLGALEDSVASVRPLLVLGTAFNFVHLIEMLRSRQIRVNLPPGSRVMETGGYKGRARSIPRKELHGLISEQLGVPLSWIVCEYGMSELSSQAYDHIASPGDRSTQRIFRFPPWARARIISPETGHEVALNETGLIQVFDLANVRSVMAIQTDDLGVRHDEGFELLGRAVRAEPRGCSLQSV